MNKYANRPVSGSWGDLIVGLLIVLRSHFQDQEFDQQVYKIHQRLDNESSIIISNVLMV